jgi:hypothetical protein
MNPLKGLRHGLVTDLKEGVVNNGDAILLLIHNHGGVAPLVTLLDELSQWQPDIRFAYLFKKMSYSSAGLLGSSPSSRFGQVFSDKERRTYFYQSSKGIYSLSIAGMIRLRELGLVTN